jgi:hypothetical protein
MGVAIRECAVALVCHPRRRWTGKLTHLLITRSKLIDCLMCRNGRSGHSYEDAFNGHVERECCHSGTWRLGGPCLRTLGRLISGRPFHFVYTEMKGGMGDCSKPFSGTIAGLEQLRHGSRAIGVFMIQNGFDVIPSISIEAGARNCRCSP